MDILESQLKIGWLLVHSYFDFSFRCPKGCISRLKFCTTDSKTQQINPSQRIRRILIKIPSIVQPNRFQHNKPTDPRVVVAGKWTY